MNEQIILFGSGTIGRVVARQLMEKKIVPVCFADNDPAKWLTFIEGVSVRSPEYCREAFPDAVWIPTVLRTPFRAEIETQLADMGVKVDSLYRYLSVHSKPFNEIEKVLALVPKDESGDETSAVLWDQYEFRKHGDLTKQRPPRDIKHVYFEDFFTRLPDEHFVDCGAADGDTVEAFLAWSRHCRHITAYEPDDQNYAALVKKYLGHIYQFNLVHAAVGAQNGKMRFAGTADQTSHLDSDGSYDVNVVRLDDQPFNIPPTFIKMDIEGSELDGLMGAREIISRHTPVLAICAYHEPDHIWQIPLAIHALNPNYKLFLRRYLEATWELIWYAVPRERLI